MKHRSTWAALKKLLHTEFLHLTQINRSDRLWQMPFAAALASGLPLLVGAACEQLSYGLVASLGGLVFLYLSNTPLHHRMVVLMACSFAMAAAYTLGIISHFFPPLMMPILIFTAILASMLCRFYALGGPGSLFFIMVAAIGAYTPSRVLEVPLMVGLFTLGTLLACIIAFFYSLYTLCLREPDPIVPIPPASFDFVILVSVIIGIFIGISLVLAQSLDLQKAYWVPVSCLAVMQGASLRAVWNKQIHRLVGTVLGLLLSWAIFLLPLNQWSISIAIMVLAFIVESTVTRHYAIAAIFITPLTLLLAEAATLGHTSPYGLIQARFFDTVLGCVIGLVGGACIHSPRFRNFLGEPIRHLLPSRHRNSDFHQNL